LHSSFTLFRIILGDFDFIALEYANRILGPIYFTTFVFFVFFVLLNMFLAIINDTYAQVKSEMKEAKNEFELMQIFKSTWDSILNRVRSKRSEVQQVRNALNTADENNDGKIQLEELRAKMQAEGQSQQAIDKIFAKYDLDGDRVLNEAEQKLLQQDLKVCHSFYL
jgi:polycystin 2